MKCNSQLDFKWDYALLFSYGTSKIADSSSTLLEVSWEVATLLELSTQNIYPINSASTGNNSLSFKLQTLSVSAYPQELFSAGDSFFWGGWDNPFGKGSLQVSFPFLYPFKFLCSVELSSRVWLRCGLCLTWVGMKMASDIVKAAESCTCSFLLVFSTLCFLHLTLSLHSSLSTIDFLYCSVVSSQISLSLLSYFLCLKCFEQNETAKSFCNENSPLRFRYSPLSALPTANSLLVRFDATRWVYWKVSSNSIGFDSNNTRDAHAANTQCEVRRCVPLRVCACVYVCMAS